MRQAEVNRKTLETEIQLKLDLDGSGLHQIATGVGFFNHMLSHIAVHGLFDLEVAAQGDLEVDAHHTVEDCALVLGQAFDQALADRAGITRIGSAYVPMDEALAFVAVDFSGRPWSVVDADFRSPAIGSMPTSLVAHFIRSLAAGAKATIHARVLYAEDDHHAAEALYKALGRALDSASRLDARRTEMVPSTKGRV